MRKILIASLLLSSPALADFTAKDASLATITFKNPNVCTSVACVPIFQQTDGSGAAIGVAGSPLYFAFGTGVTLPAFTSTPTFNLGTIGTAATAAAQTSGNASLTSLDAKTPALGQAVAGSSSPVVLPATQITALTPPAAITGFALESGGNLASLVAQIGAVTASPTANTVLDRLKTLNTTLGTPFQAGGSIGNTAFGISGTLPAFASTPTVNVGTMPTTTVTGTVSVGNFPATQPISAAALPLPTGAATAANQTNATAKTQIVDGSGNVIASTTNALNVNCANCSGGGGGGTSSNFAATFPTAGTAAGMSQGGNMVALTGTGGSLNANVTNFPATQPVSGTFWQATQPVSGTFFQATQPVSNAGTFAVQVTSAPSTAVTNAGTFATQVTSLPANASVNHAQLNGVALGSPSNYGTTPGAVAVQGVNAFITNTVPVSGTFFQATQPVSNAGTFAVQNNAATPAGANLIGSVTALGNVASLATDSGNPVKIGGVYNATAPAPSTGQRVDLQLDSAGSQLVDTEGRKQSFSAAGTITLAAAATDVLMLSGSGTKVITITSVRLTGVATANTTANPQLVKRSALDTGGTSTSNTTIGKHDSNNATSTATILAYTANPTPGANAGVFRQQQMTFGIATSSTVPIVPVEWDFTTRNAQGFKLRGSAECMTISMQGVTVTGGFLTYSIEWTEE